MKKTGPGESSLIAMATIIYMMGKIVSRNVREKRMSKVRFRRLL